MVLRNQEIIFMLVLLTTSIVLISGFLTNLTKFPDINQWQLFSCYITNVNYIKIVQIYESSKNASDWYINAILKDIYENLQMPIYVQKFNLTYEEKFYKYSELFTLQGEKLELRKSQKIYSELIDDSYNNSWTTGREEHWFGVLVIVDTIDILFQYLHGSARPPFKTPRALYVIVILENVQGHLNKFELILETLWRKYEIFKIVLTTANAQKNFFTFNPFVEKEKLVDSDNVYDYWGAIEENWIDNTTVCRTTFLDIPQNLNGYPISAIMFRNVPLSINWTELSVSFQNNYLCDVMKYSTEFGGFDGIMYGNLVKEMNMTPIIRVQDDINVFGYKRKDGSFGGTFGELLYGKSAMAVNQHFLIRPSSREIEYLYPALFDQYCIIIPKAPRVPKAFAVLKCYNATAWLAIVLTNFILGILWKYFRSWALFITSTENIKNFINLNQYARNIWQSMIIDMWLVMTSGATPLRTFSSSEKVFLTSCLVLGLITNGIFQGSVMTSFSTILYYKDIDTLSALDKSNIPILTNSEGLREMIFGYDEDDSPENAVISSLRNKLKIPPYEVSLKFVAEFKNASVLYQYADFHIMREYYQSSTGVDWLYAIPECPRKFHGGYIVRKGWPLIDRINHIFLYLTSGGFFQYWYEAVQHAIILEMKIIRINRGWIRNPRRPYSLNDTVLAFAMLLCGYLISILVLICEILWLKYSTKPSRVLSRIL